MRGHTAFCASQRLIPSRTLAESLECSVTKVSRLETGRGIPKARDVRDLLGLYQVDDQKVVDRLVRLAGDGRRQAWWQDLSEIVSSNMDTFIALESEASNLRYCVQSVIPGVFQTEEYARELFRLLYPRDSEQALQMRVDLRIGRQVSFADREDKPRVSAIMDEARLHRMVGGPDVMDNQLRALLEASERPDVTLRIHPFAAGPDLGNQCTFVVFTFESEYDRNSVHIELGAGDRWLEQESDVLRYARLFDDLGRKCLSVEDSQTQEQINDRHLTSKDHHDITA